VTKKPVGAAAPMLLSGAALADPVGHYMVRGTNPNGSTYNGEVLVTRTGQTFRVVWRIGRQSFVGTGIASDETIAVSYQAGGRAGIALYGRKFSGRWEGVCTVAGSRETGTDVWIPHMSPPLRYS
jgi:hypothetical protein